jgi:hypothetical protein
MKQKLGLLLVIGGLVLASLVVVHLLSTRTPKEGVLKVTSTPNASIFLDNKEIGQSPLEDKVASGEYTIKLVPQSTINSLPSWEAKVSIGASTLTFVNRDFADSELTSAGEILWLQKISSRESEVTVTTTPDGATVLLDNETKGTTPISLNAITAGDHSLTVTSPGFLSRTLKIRSTNGYNLNIAVQLALSGATPTPEASPSSAPSTTSTPGPTPKPTTKASTGVEPAKPYALIKDTPTGFLRVRAEPSTSASESARVNPGEKYSILGSEEGWYQIKYSTTINGWISSQYTTKVE